MFTMSNAPRTAGDLLSEESDDQLNRDLQVADGLLKQASDDSFLSWRYRTIIKMNPYMANNPSAVAAMASMNIPMLDLQSQAGALYGMQASNTLANLLPSYSDSVQRSIYATLTPAQQQTLSSVGYKVPERSVHEGGFWEMLSKPVSVIAGGIGRVAAPVLSPALDVMFEVGDAPMKVYRTIRQLDGASQMLALAAGIGIAVATGPAILALLPAGAASTGVAAAALTGSRIALPALAGMIGAGATSFASSAVINGGTSTWVNAWNAAYNGERIFTLEGTKRAREILENDQLVAVAQDLAAESGKPGDLLEIARDLVGVRGGGSPASQIGQIQKAAQRYADPGTPAFQLVAETLAELITIPAFQDAVSVLEKSKISIGRDIARGVGLDPTSGAGRWLSGSIDAASIMILDPFFLAGAATKAAAQTRRGLQFVEGTNIVARFKELATRPEVQRKLQVVANAIEAEDITLLNRGAREYKPIFDSLVVYKRTSREAPNAFGHSYKVSGQFGANDVVEFLTGADQMKTILKGIGVVQGVSYSQLRGLNRAQALFANVGADGRDFLRGIADLRLENTKLIAFSEKILKDERVGAAYAQMLDNIEPELVSDLVAEGLSDRAARVVARMLANKQVSTILGTAAETVDDVARLFNDVTPEIKAEAQTYIDNVLKDSSRAYQLGRKVGAMPGSKVFVPMASLVDGLTTRIPNGAIHLTGTDAPEEIANFVELFRYAGVPSYVRKAWTNAILTAPNGGARLVGLTALLDSVASATGMRLTKAGSDMLDEFLYHTKKMYSVGQGGRFGLPFDEPFTIPLGTRPIQDMATMIAIPDLHTIRKSVEEGLLVKMLLGIPENTHILAIQNRFWKPAVLMRMGFIIRNLGEEALTMIMRYGQGRWAQEFVGRQSAKTMIYTEAQRKNLLNKRLSQVERFAIKSRYDVPAPFRSLARAIDAVEDGELWQRVMKDYSKAMSKIMARVRDGSTNVLEVLRYGIGRADDSQYANLRKKLQGAMKPADLTEANASLKNYYKRLAFGNEYSLRRMLAGGVDPGLLESAIRFESQHLKTIVERVGTRNLSPWPLNDERQNLAARIITDENGEEILFIPSLSERGLATRGNPLPNHRDWYSSHLARIQGLTDEPTQNAALDVVAKIVNPDVEQVVPRDVLYDILGVYADAVYVRGVKWDDDFFHLWTVLNHDIPSPARFRAALASMRIPEAKIDEMLSEGLIAWAIQRNELVSMLEVAFPGQRVPAWREVSDLLYNESRLARHLDDTVAQVVDRETGEIVTELVDRTGLYDPRFDGLELVDVNGQSIQDLFGFRRGYTSLRDQFAALDKMSEKLDAAAKTFGVRDHVNMMLYRWNANPTWLDPQSVLKRGQQPPPPFVAYIGSDKHRITVNEAGDLVIALDPDSTFISRGNVEFDLSSTAISNDADVIFVVDGNEVLAATNTSVDMIRPVGDAELADPFFGRPPTPPDRFDLSLVELPGAPFAPDAAVSIGGTRRLKMTGGVADKEIVLRKGSWEARVKSQVADAYPDIINNSTEQVYSPFFNGLDDAMPAMRMAAAQELNSPEYLKSLQLNPRWAGETPTRGYYVVDTRGPIIATMPTGYDSVGKTIPESGAAFDHLPFTKRGLWIGREEYRATQTELIINAISQQQPLIVSSREAAEELADLIAELRASANGLPPSRVNAQRPGIGYLHLPTDQKGSFGAGFARYKGRIASKAGPIDVEFVGYAGLEYEMKQRAGKALNSGDLERLERARTHYDEYPLTWNWVEELQAQTGPTEILDVLIDDLLSNIRAGRRLRVVVRDSDSVPTLYRNVAGFAEPVKPGEIIESSEELFTSVRMDQDSLVRIGDQRYFETELANYEGNNELLWDVIRPVLYDDVESLHRPLYERKNPVKTGKLGEEGQVAYLGERRLRYASTDHVARTPTADLPDWEIVQVYKPNKQTFWDKAVNGFFNKFASPVIDALVRQPMAFHAFALAADRNKNTMRWLITASKEEEALRDVMLRNRFNLATAGVDEPRVMGIWSDFGRLAGRVHGDKLVRDWDDLMAISYVRGLSVEEFSRLFDEIDFALANRADEVLADYNKVERARVRAAVNYAKQNQNQIQTLFLSNSTDDFLAQIDLTFGIGSAMAGGPIETITAKTPQPIRDFATSLTEEDWAVIKASAIQRDNISQEAYEYAAEHAIRDTMPFVDSHQIRSQWAEYMRGLLPFWYAEENFLKRWAKIFAVGGPAVTLEKVRKLQLTYMGLKNVGIVRTDSEGRDWFIYPGSDLFIKALDKVFPGQTLPVSAFLQTQTTNILPGFQPNFGRPSLNPFSAISLNAIANLFPEVNSLEEALLGEEYVNQSIVRRIVPAHINNVWNALGTFADPNLNPSNTRVASAMNAAIAHLDAEGMGLPDNATAGQIDDYLRKVREHARIIVFAQALGGWFMPGAPSTLQTTGGSSLSWITNGAIEDPKELLSSSYFELISKLGVEKGTQAYIAIAENEYFEDILNPLAYTVGQTVSESGAPLPTTREGIDFYLNNRDVFDAYPEAGPWLFPQDNGKNGKRSTYAYDSAMITGLRRRRSPEEVLRTMKFKEGASVYFKSQKEFEEAYVSLRNSGQDDQAKALKLAFNNWADSWKATHPVFAEMLVSDDARQRRRRTIDQMRYLLNDPQVPKASHFEALKVLMKSFDEYSIARGQLGLDRTAAGNSQLLTLKAGFEAWVDQYIMENPELSSFWLTVLRPESGLE